MSNSFCKQAESVGHEFISRKTVWSCCFKRYPTKDPCAICCGVIPTNTSVDGVFSPWWGARFTFGADISQQWNEQNGLELVASKSPSTRHGWIKLESWTTSWKKFSLPNYCYRCGNQAAIMEVDENLNKTFLQFDPLPRWGEPHNNRRTPEYFL
jgi:hypothetical protein